MSVLTRVAASYGFTDSRALIAAAVTDNGNDGQGFSADHAWFYVTLLTIGYMVSRGLAKTGSYAKDDKFESHTMVHELTHQMMHFHLDFLPQWVVEGTAEYTGILPLRNGHFRVSAAKNGLKDYIDFLKKRTVEGVPEPYPLDELFAITNEKFSGIRSAFLALVRPVGRSTTMAPACLPTKQRLRASGSCQLNR